MGSKAKPVPYRCGAETLNVFYIKCWLYAEKIIQQNSFSQIGFSCSILAQCHRTWNKIFVTALCLFRTPTLFMVYQRGGRLQSGAVIDVNALSLSPFLFVPIPYRHTVYLPCLQTSYTETSSSLETTHLWILYTISLMFNCLFVYLDYYFCGYSLCRRDVN